jgi:hypothetical protein
LIAVDREEVRPTFERVSNGLSLLVVDLEPASHRGLSVIRTLLVAAPAPQTFNQFGTRNLEPHDERPGLQSDQPGKLRA